VTTIIVCGGQFGDEGKGKIVSYLANAKKIKYYARAGTGPNAGHTVVVDNVEYRLQLIPSGFFIPDSKMYIGAGMLVNPEILLREINEYGGGNRVFIDGNTGIIEPHHIERDKNSDHLREIVGSTGTGCGPANEDRAKRILKLAKDIPELKPYIIDVSSELNDIIDRGEDLIIEGSQATYLSLIHGTYPYVTSKDVTASTIAADVGVGPTKIDEVILVLKAFVTRVGAGPLEGELPPEEVKARGWEEYGTVTRRLRRAAPFNYQLAKKATQINGATQIALTKMDVLFPELKGATEFSKISGEGLAFIKKIEDVCKVPVKYISTGPSADALIVRDSI
jgi:adenylosuccinate synthase